MTIILFLLVITVIAIGLHSFSISRDNIFEPIYFILIGYIGVFVIQPLTGSDELLNKWGEDPVSYGLFLAWIMLIILYAGYRSPIVARLAFHTRPPTLFWFPGRLIPYGLFLVALGFTGQLLFIAQSGGTEIFFGTARGAGNYETTTAYIYSAQWFLVAGLSILFLEISQGKTRIKSLVYFLALFYFLFQFIIGQRSGVFLIGISILAWHFLPSYPQKRIPITRIIIIGMFVMLLVGFVATFRDEFYIGSKFKGVTNIYQQDLEDQITTLYNGVIKGGGETVLNGEFDGYLQALDAVPDRVEHDLGTYYQRYLYHWIPRSWWPEKPNVKDSIRNLVNEVPALINGCITMLGMYHYHFGLIGMVIGSLLTGAAFGFLENWRKAHVGDCGVLLIYFILYQYGRGVVMVAGLFEGLDTLIPFYIAPIVLGFLYLKLTYRAVLTTQASFYD